MAFTSRAEVGETGASGTLHTAPTVSGCGTSLPPMSAVPLQILAPSGDAAGSIDTAELRDLYAAMIEARAYDTKASAMQRQGRLATYSPFEGQEAAQIGAASALEPQDWLVATYRDAAAMWFHGYPWAALFLGRTGDERGGAPPAEVNVLPSSITVGGHMIHAVGIGWAQILKGTGAVAMTMFGDGATSEGDFHEAMNFAAVYSTPTVFFCENNGWAISMPRERQTVSETIASKAVAYGMPSALVDGNDVVAVRRAAVEAVARARAGSGPTLIEAVTYRLGPHTTTDDAARYRHDDDVDAWRKRDPVDRVRRYLEAQGAWDGAWQAELVDGAARRIEEAVADAEAVPALGAGEIFDGMFHSPTTALEHQRALLLEEIES